jgi:hypothetical protein
LLGRRELFPTVEGRAETFCDLPLFFDELNDALEAHDVMRPLLARQDENEEALSIGASAR